jgi:hypothetical protein
VALVPDRGGPKLGSGREASSPDWVRSERICTTFRRAEARDLERIADAWGVPLATALWAIVHERLRTWRRAPVELGEVGLQVQASLGVLQGRGTARRSGADAPDEAPG